MVHAATCTRGVLTRQMVVAQNQMPRLSLLAQEYWTQPAEDRTQSSASTPIPVSGRLYTPNHDIPASARQLSRSTSASQIMRMGSQLRARSANGGTRDSQRHAWGDMSSRPSTSASTRRRRRKNSTGGNPLWPEPEDKMSVFEVSRLQPDTIKLINRVESAGGSLRHKNPRLKRGTILCSKVRSGRSGVSRLVKRDSLAPGWIFMCSLAWQGRRRIRSALPSRKVRQEREERWSSQRRYAANTASCFAHIVPVACLVVGSCCLSLLPCYALTSKLDIAGGFPCIASQTYPFGRQGNELRCGQGCVRGVVRKLVAERVALGSFSPTAHAHRGTCLYV